MNQLFIFKTHLPFAYSTYKQEPFSKKQNCIYPMYFNYQGEYIDEDDLEEEERRKKEEAEELEKELQSWDEWADDIYNLHGGADWSGD